MTPKIVLDEQEIKELLKKHLADLGLEPSGPVVFENSCEQTVLGLRAEVAVKSVKPVLEPQPARGPYR